MWNTKIISVFGQQFTFFYHKPRATLVTMKKLQQIKFEIVDRVALLTLNRPNDANGMNLSLASELVIAAEHCDFNDQVRAIVLTGEGRFFCAGGDLNAMHQVSDDAQSPGQVVRQIADQLHKAIAIFSRMDKPVIAAVNGTAAGAGFSLAVAADMVIASEQAKFTMAYSNVGLSPDGSSSYFLPRLVGLRKAQELMFTNRVLSADEAVSWGLVNRVVPADDLLTSAQDLAQSLAKGSVRSNGAIKRLLSCSFDNGLETQMELESRAIAECADSPDGREGVAAFIEKRKPQFS